MEHQKRTKIRHNNKMYIVTRQGNGIYEARKEGGRKNIRVRIDEFNGAVFDTDREILDPI